jgi:glycosyltransferase involved in cell wall biosynthesis
MKSKPELSVVISTYNWPQALQVVVEGFFSQSDMDFEIVIADDGSGEATRACIERLRARAPVPLTHVWQPDEGYRLAMSRNRGILACSGDYIVVVDGDCIPRRDFIARHRKLARRGFMVTGSRILLNPGASARVLAGRLDLQSASLLDKLRLRLSGETNKLAQMLWAMPDIGREQTRFSFRRIKGCNMAIWRDDLERINGFDESFEGWGHEDADLVLRLFHAGVMRKEGAFATEVFHLWHRETSRDQASSNRRVVLERAANKTIQALKGLKQHVNEQEYADEA